MNLLVTVFAFAIGLATSVALADQKNESKGSPLSTGEVEKLLETLKTKRSPNIYSAVYYPSWKKPMDGLKSVTAEAIAEHAGEQIKGGVELEPVGDPVTVGSAGGILLKRSGGKLKDKLVAAYLYRDERGDWGFLAIPIRYKAPRILGKDGKFMAKALNSERPFEGPLYEFDEAVQKDFEKVQAKLKATQSKPADGQKKKSTDKEKSPSAR